MTGTLRRNAAVRIMKTDSVQFGKLGTVVRFMKDGSIDVELLALAAAAIEAMAVRAQQERAAGITV